MTKQRIIENAILTLNADFHAPLDKIAERAAINRRTLHRYFKDRDTLLAACWTDMMQTWQEAVLIGIACSNDPVTQLKSMFFSGIDNGVKYTFLIKLYKIYQEDNTFKTVTTPKYEQIRDQWLNLIPELQKQKIINDQLSKTWILLLFSNVIMTAIDALNSGDIAPNDIKNIAWYSFSRGIGINEK